MPVDRNRSDLLNQLVIDRQKPARPAGGTLKRPLRALLITAAAAAASGLSVFYLVHSPATVTGPAAAAPVLLPSKVAETAVENTSPHSASLLDATGYVVARRSATVSSKTTARVVEVLIEEGMTVVSGQIIARLDDATARSELLLAESKVTAAKAHSGELNARIEQAGGELARWRVLAKNALVSASQLDGYRVELDVLLARRKRSDAEVVVALRQADVLRVVLDDLVIRAPFDGIVVTKSAQPGEMISPVSAGGGFTRTGICTIVDMGSLEVEVDVNESYIDRVRVGQPVAICLNAYPQQQYGGRVLAVIPTADRSRATIRVRIAIAAADERVLPEMGVRVAFHELAEFGNNTPETRIHPVFEQSTSQDPPRMPKLAAC